MSAEIVSNIDGIVTAKVTGKLTHCELIAIQKSVISIIGQQGAICILIICEDFQGWDKDGDWEDFSLQSQSDPYIHKMAIVGDKQWEDLALMFTGKGFRKFPIEYYWPAELRQAKAWLAEP